MLPLLIFLGIAIPATELFLLILISNWIGFWYTVGIIIVTGVIGALLWRWQGFGIVGRFRTALTAGILQELAGGNVSDEKPKQSPIDVLMDGAMIFFAGGLLLTPGVLTDVVGLLLLIPLTRYLFKKWVHRWIKNRFKMMDISSTFTFQGPGAKEFMDLDNEDDDDDIIEGEIISRSDNDQERLE